MNQFLIESHLPPKAALKTHALQTLTRGPLTRLRAARLECVRFIGAFTPARTASDPMHAIKVVVAHHRIPIWSSGFS